MVVKNATLGSLKGIKPASAGFYLKNILNAITVYMQG
jgi:hypothetical protein